MLVIQAEELPGTTLCRNLFFFFFFLAEAPLAVEGTKLQCKVISLKRLSRIQKAKRKKSQYRMPHRREKYLQTER
jgi:hypothetical protein